MFLPQRNMRGFSCTAFRRKQICLSVHCHTGAVYQKSVMLQQLLCHQTVCRGDFMSRLLIIRNLSPLCHSRLSTFLLFLLNMLNRYHHSCFRFYSAYHICLTFLSQQRIAMFQLKYVLCHPDAGAFFIFLQEFSSLLFMLCSYLRIGSFTLRQLFCILPVQTAQKLDIIFLPRFGSSVIMKDIRLIQTFFTILRRHKIKVADKHIVLKKIYVFHTAIKHCIQHILIC